MAESGNHALVFGATGLIGWAIVDQLLSSYPEPDAFSKVTAVSNRPMNPSRTLWASDSPKSPELQLVSGVNLRDEDVTSQLRNKVKGVEHVTHVFYFGGLLQCSGMEGLCHVAHKTNSFFSP